MTLETSKYKLGHMNGERRKAIAPGQASPAVAPLTHLLGSTEFAPIRIPIRSRIKGRTLHKTIIFVAPPRATPHSKHVTFFAARSRATTRCLP